MLKKLITTFCLTSLCIGCATTPKQHVQEIRVKTKVAKKMQEALETSRGYTLAEIAAFKPYMQSKKCVWCADYIKKTRGFITRDDPIGTVKRLCGTKWKKICAKKVTLGDGSIWISLDEKNKLATTEDKENEPESTCKCDPF